MRKRLGRIKRKALRNIRRIPETDRTKRYWEIASKADIETTMELICDGFDREKFEDTPPHIFNNYIKNGDLKNKRFLDLACGIGRSCKWVAPTVKEYVGVDFASGMIKKARQYNSSFKNTNFYVNDGKSLEIFKDESFDVVLCELAMLHIDKPVQRLYANEVFRVLKNGGSFFVQIPRIEFYRNDNYALTKEATRKLFERFSLNFLETTDADYLLRADKT